MSFRPTQAIAALGLFGCTTLSLMPLGCANSIEQAPLHQASENNGPHLPDTTAARLRECVETYQDQLSSGYYSIHYRINVDEHGNITDVETTDVPHDAPDFAACTRVALRDMKVPDWALRLRLSPSMQSTDGQTPAGRASMGTVTVMGTEIALEELLVGASGTTVLFAISIGLAVSGVKDIVDAMDEIDRCKKVKAECITYCSDTTLPTRNFGWKFQKCKNECLERHQCPRDS